MEIKGKLIIIGGAIDKGSFTEASFDENVANNLNFFEKGILKVLRTCCRIVSFTSSLIA